MRPGLPTSAVIHVALIAWILLGFPAIAPMEPPPPSDAMPIEFVPVTDQSNIRQGQKTAKPKDEMTPKDTAKAAKESDGARAGADAHEEPPPPMPQAKPEPKPEQKAAEPPKPEPVKLPDIKPEPPKPQPVKTPDPKPEPPKPEPVKVPEPKAQPPKPEPVKAPEPKPDLPKEAEKAKDVGEGKPPVPKDPPKDTKALDKIIEEQKKADEKKAAEAKAAADAKAKAAAEAKAAADAKAAAEAKAAKAAADAKAKAAADAKAKAAADAKAKAAAEAKAAADAKAAKAAEAKSFSAQMSDVINKNQTGSAASREQKTASLGSAAGKATTAKMTQAETDGLVNQIKSCFVAPVGAAEADLKVTMHFSLNQDGSLNGIPEVKEAPAHPLGPRLADAAKRALLRCGPYKLPADKFSAWQSVEATFHAKDFQ